VPDLRVLVAGLRSRHGHALDHVRQPGPGHGSLRRGAVKAAGLDESALTLYRWNAPNRGSSVGRRCCRPGCRHCEPTTRCQSDNAQAIQDERETTSNQPQTSSQAAKPASKPACARRTCAKATCDRGDYCRSRIASIKGAVYDRENRGM
jgi:hypothetical protein